MRSGFPVARGRPHGRAFAELVDPYRMGQDAAVPFDYYERLSKKEKRIYDASDRVATVPLRDLVGIRAAAAAREAALALEARRTAAKAAQSLSDAICRDLEVAPAKVKVLSRRPSDDE